METLILSIILIFLSILGGKRGAWKRLSPRVTSHPNPSVPSARAVVCPLPLLGIVSS